VHGCAAPSTSASPREPVFQAASLSKPLFAYAVLKLVREGKLDLDAPVLTYLPQGYSHKHYPWAADSPVDRVADARLGAITVRMALSHTSGLPNWAGGPLELDRQPGGAWRYSGEGYVLLQRAVETVTGEPLDKYMRRAVFDPLGMTRSAYTSEARLAPFVAAGMDDYGNAVKPALFMEPVAAFSLYTSAADYARFLAALLNDERMLAAIVAAPVPVDAKLDLSWGLGWELERIGADVFLWHWGNNPGYKAFVMASPRSGDAFVLFTNSDKGMALAEPIGNDVLPGPHPVFGFSLLH
jgi:CubicO group peptidase (beta-lactamase class C family)